MSQGTVERAFQLAQEGTCRNVTDLQKRLKSEGYFNIHGHLEGRSIRKQLADAIKQALDAKVA